MPDIPVRVAYEKEECIKEEISDMILPEMYTTEVRIHKDELKLEMPKINAVEICEMPSETKFEMSILEEPSEPKLEKPIIKETCIVQRESKLIQDTTLVSNVPTQFHAEQEISLSDRNIVCCTWSTNKRNHHWNCNLQSGHVWLSLVHTLFLLVIEEPLVF